MKDKRNKDNKFFQLKELIVSKMASPYEALLVESNNNTENGIKNPETGCTCLMKDERHINKFINFIIS